MRSKEVAELAGVSVRTLRHYHQIGVLPEPARDPNGYRSYGLAHVARLVRIRTLAELGIPLERVPTLLDDPADSAGEDLLDELAGQLEQRIARLQRQLRRVTELRASRGRPDLTPASADFLAAVGEVEPSDLAEVEHDASILLARIYETGGAPEDLRELARVVGEVRRDAQYAAFTERFESLSLDAGDDEVGELAECFVASFGPALTRVIDTAVDGRLRRTRVEDVPALDLDPRLNEAQARVLRLIGDLL